MEQNSLPAYEALKRMRNLKFVQGAYFTIIHLTCNLQTGECGEIRRHDRCQVRASLPPATFEVDGGHYFPFEDLDTEEPKMCFKILIRYIALPPDYRLLKVNWIE
ncbi:MAG: hypothetical protein LBL90_13385 [Prevotellaceae bacterium]|jgi:hypothetical protein|nr:hypothetical protein [Prevotellaceae bacterium]